MKKMILSVGFACISFLAMAFTPKISKNYKPVLKITSGDVCETRSVSAYNSETGVTTTTSCTRCASDVGTAASAALICASRGMKKILPYLD